MTDNAITRAKQTARHRMWDRLEREEAAPPGVHGHIPDFVGADRAADRLARLDVWKAATVVMANPDHAQLSVRVQALHEGKLLYVAVPRLATLKPFYRLDPTTLDVPFETAATSAGAAAVAATVRADELPPIDLVICGSVVVNRQGVRIGKGAGYSDIEVAMLTELRRVGPDTTIATTVHQLQLVDDLLPETAHDFGVDVVVTPNECVRCGSLRRPAGIAWNQLSDEQINAIPALKAHHRE